MDGTATTTVEIRYAVPVTDPRWILEDNDNMPESPLHDEIIRLLVEVSEGVGAADDARCAGRSEHRAAVGSPAAQGRRRPRRVPGRAGATRRRTGQEPADVGRGPPPAARRGRGRQREHRGEGLRRGSRELRRERHSRALGLRPRAARAGGPRRALSTPGVAPRPPRPLPARVRGRRPRALAGVGVRGSSSPTAGGGCASPTTPRASASGPPRPRVSGRGAPRPRRRSHACARSLKRCAGRQRASRRERRRPRVHRRRGAGLRAVGCGAPRPPRDGGVSA